MPRTYDSSRRAQAAERTREKITAAAFKLHGLGVLDFDSLAREADVSVATVRKHFPTRELVYEACTAYGMHQVPMPDIAALVAIKDPQACIREAVTQTYSLLDLVGGQMWTALKLEDESPAMANGLSQMEQMTLTMAGMVIATWGVPEHRLSEMRGVVVGLLSPLTYRALRHYGGLSQEQAIEQSVGALVHAFRALETKEAAQR
jgi:AcrR family transcriptional regulator